MVLRPEPVFASVEAVAPAPTALPARARAGGASTRPRPARWPSGDGFSLLCGRYEGVDHRIREHLVDGELSIGDYVLAGGEVAACVVIEAVTRLLPGVMGNERSVRARQSFAAPERRRAPDRCWRSPSTPGRPRSGAGRCPRSLRSGDHARIARWRRAQALHRTVAARPDLIAARGGLTDEEQGLLEEFDPVAYP